MRIDRLDLIAFGLFTDVTLDFGAGDSGLHIIYGDNEAGKSTTLRALTALLFGVESHTPDNFLHGNPQIRVGGRLRLTTGESLDFVRRKGNKGTLLHPETGDALDDAVLAPYLPGLDQALFELFYGIDHRRLEQGGEQLLAQSGDLGQALYSAAMGTAGLRPLLADLKGGADALFAPRASKKPVNQAIARFKAAKSEIRKSSVTVAEWERLQQRLDKTQKALDRVEATRAELGRQHSRLGRVRRVQGALVERRDVLARLVEMGDVLRLPPEFSADRRDALERIRNAREHVQRTEGRLARQEQERASIQVRDELLDNEETIIALFQKLGSVDDNIKDRPRQDSLLRVKRNEAAVILKGIRPGLSLDEVEPLRPVLHLHKEIAELAQQHGVLSDRATQQTTRTQHLERERRALADKREVLGEVEADGNRQRQGRETIAAARRAGDLDARVADARAQASRAHQTCETALQRLGRFGGELGELAGMAVPEAATLDRFEGLFGERHQRARDRERLRRELARDQAEATKQLAELLSSGEVPTLAELETSRGARDDLWRQIRPLLEGGQKSPGELPDTYEHRVKDADHVADRLRTDAKRVEQRAHLEAQIARLDERGHALAQEETADTEAQEAVLHDWRELWAPLNVEPGAPAEMKQWLLRVERLQAEIDAARASAQEAEGLVALRTAHLEALRAAFAGAAGAAQEDASLEDRLSHCEESLAEAEARATRRAELDREIGRLQADVDQLREQDASLDTERARWREKWSRAVEGLGLEPDAPPAHALEVMEQHAQLFSTLDKADEAKRRLYGMEKHEERFETRVQEFVARCGLEQAGQEARATVGQLHRDLQGAREARASLRKLDADLRDTRAEAEEAQLALGGAEERLAEMRRQARVEHDEELEQAERRSKQHRDLERRRDDLERNLARLGDGLSLAELEEEAAGVDPDTLVADHERVAAQLQEVDAERDGRRDERRSLADEIQAMDGSAAAAEASEEAAHQLATLSAGAEQYLRLRIAARLLEHQIDQYRRQHQTPVLKRAGALFAQLTRGTYASLRDELDPKGQPILLGVLPNQREVPVAGMSDGTRDQLFLALRLATLEQQLTKPRAEPMPLVADDVLVGFDDDRTRAGLETLSAFSQKTQVLLFTHHSRVVELARDLGDPAAVVHTL